MNPKAISGVITAILLIVISVILVLIILSWGRQFTITRTNKANELINDDCDKATIHVSDCKIVDDGNIFLIIKNSSSSYTFKESDVFKVQVYNDSGLMDEEIELTLASGSWSGLEPGEQIIGNIEPISPQLTESSGALVNVTVRSTICPLVATTSYGCHR